MNKNAIQKFAIWARNELIAQVSQRAYQYGIDESGFGDASADTLNGRLLTAEEKSQRQELIKQIKEKGYQQVMEEVAYTWFNRFIALRFMEVNNYLPSHIRVFSDASGAFKPEILNDVLHLDLPGLDSGKVAEYIESNDTEALYRYLLLTQCNALNSALPVMFERMGGYTEMLLPNNILRQDSVLGHMVSDIPEEDWQDAVQIIGWLYQYYNTELKDDTFAQLKKNVKITKERIPAATQLFTPDWIVRYMVENSLGRLWLEGHPNAELHDGWKYYLDEAKQEPDVEDQLAKLREEYKTIKPEEIKVIDPCMGSGHILVYAFDVLMQIYTSAGWDQREAAQSILKNNLFGLDIDDRAAQLAYFAVMMKARQYDRRLLTRGIQPNVYSIRESNGIQAMTIEYFHKNDPKLKADIESIVAEMRDAKEYGSILNITPVDFAGLYARFDEIREDIDMMQKPALEELLPLVKCAEVLAQKYDVVVTNPPYMNSSGMDGALSQYVSRNYEIGKYDLFSVMIIKCLHFVRKSGYLSLITMESWMFRPSFEKLRKMLLSQNTFISLIHMPYLGKGNNSMEISFGTAAFVIQPQYQENYNSQFDYIRYFELNAELEPLQFPIINERYVQMNVQGLLAIPGAPFGYWGSNRLCNLIAGQQLGSAGSAKSGMQTGNNDIFLRFWYEPSNQNICLDIRSFDELIERDPKWVPQTKGGDYRKWYGNHNYVVLSKDDFSAIRGYNGTVRIRDPRQYFVEGITWSHTSSRCFGARYLPDGFTFNVESPSFFSRGCSNAFVLGLLNSTIAEAVLRLVNQTMSYQSVDIERIPLELTDSVITGVIENKTDENVAISKKDWDSYETSWDFKRNPLV